MPTVLRSGPYRIYFYSHEPNAPPHVHVDREDWSAKFWLRPAGLAVNLGFGPVSHHQRRGVRRQTAPPRCIAYKAFQTYRLLPPPIAN
ncbi:MAG: DUF4160 domain-containing protein [Bryobacteraceae bacterium]